MFEINGLKVKLPKWKWWQWLVFIVCVIMVIKGDREVLAFFIELVRMKMGW